MGMPPICAWAGGNFLTGAGGFLQGLWAGWAGMRIRLDSLDFITPRVPVSTTSLKLRGISYLATRFDLVLSAQQGSCFRGWVATTGARGAPSLKIGELGSGSGSFVPLTSEQAVCFPAGHSVRIVGPPELGRAVGS
jgi:hypothetical protein